MSIAGTQPSKSELKIYFGLGNDDDLMLVKNIRVDFVNPVQNQERMNGAERWGSTYKKVKVISTCDRLHVTGYGYHTDDDGEMIIPMSNIAMIRIDWMPGQKDPTKA